jgi:hypothetical protein
MTAGGARVQPVLRDLGLSSVDLGGEEAVADGGGAPPCSLSRVRHVSSSQT